MCLSRRCSSCQHSAIDSGIDHHNLHDVTKSRRCGKRGQHHTKECFCERFTKENEERGGCIRQSDYLMVLSKRQIFYMLLEAFDEGFTRASINKRR